MHWLMICECTFFLGGGGGGGGEVKTLFVLSFLTAHKN